MVLGTLLRRVLGCRGTPVTICVKNALNRVGIAAIIIPPNSHAIVGMGLPVLPLAETQQPHLQVCIYVYI